MKIGACQLAVTGDMEANLQQIREAVARAAQAGVQMLFFPECALTGYPPRDIPHPGAVDFEQAGRCYGELERLARAHRISIVVGTITQADGRHYNAALLFTPEGRRTVYRKRALWGWDAEHFAPGSDPGVFEADGVKIGLRICYEIRFPEYFRELYVENTDLNVILFYDVSDRDDADRYDLIRAHVRTRAVENVCYTLSVNAAGPHQTAPTGLYDPSGRPVCELERNRPGLLIHDLHPWTPDFGQRGRKEISDRLCRARKP